MRYFTLILISFFAVNVIAQDNCANIVTNALTQLDNLCEHTARNEVCYGHARVSVKASGQQFTFSQAGDVISILDVESIHTGPFVAPDEWGIALMRVQANLPDSLPGQNVTFLLFGEAELSNVDSAQTANAPMQSVYFNSGIGQTTCSTVPPDGLLIQTPRGVGTVQLQVNEVHIQLGSTVYLQAANGIMTVSVLEGFAILDAFDVTQIIPAGTATRVPLGEDGGASGPPEYPRPYDAQIVQTLPLKSDTLEGQIVSAPIANQTSTTQGPVESGQYAITWSVIAECPDTVLEFPETWVTVLNADESVTTFGRTWIPTSDTTYTYADEFGETGVIVFTSPTTFTGWWAILLQADGPQPCQATYGVIGEWIGP